MPREPDYMAPSSQFKAKADDILDRLEGRAPNRTLGLEDRKAVERIADMGGRGAERAERLLALHDVANGYGAAPPVKASGLRERVAGAVKRGKAAVERGATATKAMAHEAVDRFKAGPLYPHPLHERLTSERDARAVIREVRGRWGRDFDCDDIDDRVRKHSVRSMRLDFRKLLRASNELEEPVGLQREIMGIASVVGLGAAHGATGSVLPTVAGALAAAVAHLYGDADVALAARGPMRALGACLLYQVGHRAAVAVAPEEEAA